MPFTPLPLLRAAGLKVAPTFTCSMDPATTPPLFLNQMAAGWKLITSNAARALASPLHQPRCLESDLVISFAKASCFARASSAVVAENDPFTR